MVDVVSRADLLTVARAARELVAKAWSQDGEYARTKDGAPCLVFPELNGGRAHSFSAEGALMRALHDQPKIERSPSGWAVLSIIRAVYRDFIGGTLAGFEQANQFQEDVVAEFDRLISILRGARLFDLEAIARRIDTSLRVRA